MNFGRVLRLSYLGAILSPGIICFGSAVQTKNQAIHPPVAGPTAIDRLSADGGAPPPPVIPKKPTHVIAA